ncbi:FAD/FMN-containing protein [Eremomyces bilateralis CBS 781.70]|uniref:FAD/FMN-containing protein n=1 Tax=Eremomyces bilateralis CBS 781.70 TaxID=1392243 RepID=A0A6G1GGY0_9PEZI|nr:FAD/FMN-containing protein [Eremomyces bilateralis CBS 781.70]KAF1817328.1 FAD/FMN-containing protein [Eremomyces bilateralis CBS 781.70]
MLISSYNSALVCLAFSLPTLSLAGGHPHHARERCSFGDRCWPSSQEWRTFNKSVSGRLIASVPAALPCHDPDFNEGDCQAARTGWEDSFWRTGEPGAYSAIVWEMWNDLCLINGTQEERCGQGIVPKLSVDVQTVEDVQKSVNFAMEKYLYLVVKNTGHCHLGRSSGKGGFSIWTHNMKGRDWQDSFVPKDAPAGTSGIPAVTLQAGEQWRDIYIDGSERNRIVVGGSARTVGAAGGYLTGGGHSPFAHFYGLAVDNLLEVSLVTATGEAKIVNQYTDPDYFYAVRGGGGSSWGVITSVTYKTHPSPSHMHVGLVQFNGTDEASRRLILEKALAAIPSVTEGGYIGYGVQDQGFQGLFSQANATNDTFTKAFAPFFEITQLPGVSGQVFGFKLPSWRAYIDTFLTDPNIATNNVDTTRLLTKKVLQTKNKELVDLAFSYEGGCGFNFIGNVAQAERDNVATHDIWKESHTIFSIGSNYEDDAPTPEKVRKRRQTLEISKRLTEIVGEDGGTYINEASPFEPDWQNVFWGAKYKRLLKIKRKVDPTNLFVCNRCVGSDLLFEPWSKL